MPRARMVSDWLAERGMTMKQLSEASGLERHVVEAIAQGRYTTSLEQRRRLAAALGVEPEQIASGHYAKPENYG